MNDLEKEIRINIVKQALLLNGKNNKLQQLFGLDSKTVEQFLTASRLIVTLPHASPNIFFPKVSASWYARHLQKYDDSVFHLRVVLSHNNFGDLGWRPYAWWYLDKNKIVRKASLFTRNKKKKHVTVLSQPPIEKIDAIDMSEFDRSLSFLASGCINRAWSYITIMASIERAAGLSLENKTLYITFDQLIMAIRQCKESSITQKINQFLSTRQARCLSSSGELQPCDYSSNSTILYDNPTNIALLSILGVEGVVGGQKMKNYWPEVAFCEEALGTQKSPMRVLLIPEGNQISQRVGPSSDILNQLSEHGIPYSQGIALSEHGSFAKFLDPF
ncbi:hypothetical protein MSP8887_03676 [Marinomonas spartinae]|uniref:hypothetical protein n=1 Tax=Marinomonas spartinae TaxID=1792290 RepID=UPI000808C162|nr:hypothetical protein [Marinomonas spartinae]SBS39137.1 hypothetical protein MSP8887_03676 [Marinomonas spartinae]